MARDAAHDPMKALVWRMDTPDGETLAIIGVADRYVIFREREWRLSLYTNDKSAQAEAQRLTASKQRLAPVLVGPVVVVISGASWLALAMGGMIDRDLTHAITTALSTV